MGQLVRLDACTVVDDLKVDLVIPAADVEQDLLVRAAVFDGVGQEIGDDLFDLILIADHHIVFFAFDADIIPVRFEQPVRVGDGFGRCQNIEGSDVQLHRAGLHL